MRTILSRSTRVFHQSHQRWPRKFAIATGLALATFTLCTDLAIPAYAQEAIPLNSGEPVVYKPEPVVHKVIQTEPAAAAKPAEKSSEKVVKKLNTAAVEVAPLRLTSELEAVVDSPVKFEIALRPKALKELKLIGSQGHSQRVSRGQLVLQLEAEGWERARRAAEQAMTSAEQDVKQAAYALESLEESSRIELETAELANNRAQEELEFFLNEGRKNSVEDLEASLEYSQQNVEYTREEYEQLKKMYDADELTEESEEIVLKRSLNDLKRAERNLMLTERRVKRAMEVDLDRQEAGLKNSAAKAKIDLEKLEKGQEAKKVLAKVAAARAEAGFEASKKELANLNEDRQYLTIASPINGILFFGAVKDSWKGASSVEDVIFLGNNLPTNRTLMTVVTNEKLFVRANLPERLYNAMKPGDSAFFEATSQPGSRIELVCEEKVDVPLDPGSYRVTFRFVRASDSEGLLPLMSGKITASHYEKEKALLVPIEAIRYEGAKTFVLVYSESDGQSTRQEVVLGKRDGKRVEINQGLREGEHVVLP